MSQQGDDQMSLFLHTNLSALQSQYALQRSTAKLDTSYERLSTGLRINSAKDDPAGMQTADRFTREINALDETNRVAQNGISYAQTAEGAIDEISTMLQRIRTLALQSANGTNTPSDRKSLQQEVDQLNEEICRIANRTTFAGEDILSGNASIARFQISPDPNSLITIDLRCGFQTGALAKLAGEFSTGGPGSTAQFTITDDHGTDLTYNFTDVFSYKINGGGIDISTYSAAQAVLGGIDHLINAVDFKRAELGAIENRLESTIRNQSNIASNVSESRSRIRDTDYAEEATEMATQQILQQGAASILTQANSRPEIALQILNQG